MDALSNEKWADFYRFLSPSVRAKCSAKEFETQISLVFTLFKGLLGIGAGEHVEFRLVDVTVSGNRGSDTTEILFRGQPLEFGADLSGGEDGWVFIDGEWWIGAEDACGGLGF